MTARAMTEDKPKTTERLVHELRQSEERHRALVELSPDAIFVNHEGKFSFLNPGAVKLFGADSQSAADVSVMILIVLEPRPISSLSRLFRS